MRILIFLSVLTFVACSNESKSSYLSDIEPTKEYFKNGQLRKIGKYNRKGLQEGEWKYYHENGQLKSIGIFIFDCPKPSSPIHSCMILIIFDFSKVHTRHR